MKFSKKVKDILETVVFNEEEFNTTDSKLFMDFLSNKRAIEIIDGLLRKSNNNPKVALDALEKMANNVKDGFQNQNELETARFGLKALNNKDQLSQKDITTLQQKLGKDFDQIFKLGTQNQKTLGAAAGGIPGYLAATALGGVANVGMNKVKDWAKKKYADRGLSDDVDNIYKQLSEDIKQATIKLEKDPYKITKLLIDNDIDPGIYDIYSTTTTVLYFPSDNYQTPYVLTGFYNDTFSQNNNFVLVFYPIWDRKMKQKDFEKRRTIQEFKDFLNDARQKDTKNIRTQKSLEYMDHYYSDAKIAAKKLKDIQYIRESLKTYSTLSLMNNLISQANVAGLSRDEQIKVLQTTIDIENGKIIDLGVPTIEWIDANVFQNRPDDESYNQRLKNIQTLITPLYDVRNQKLLPNWWLSHISEEAKNTYAYYDELGSEGLNELLNVLHIDTTEAPIDEKHYWEQLIRTTAKNVTTFTKKRFNPYGIEKRSPEHIFDDEQIANQYNNTVKTKINVVPQVIAFYLNYESDLMELNKIKNGQSTNFNSFMNFDTYEDAQSIIENMTIFDNDFINYKTQYGDQFIQPKADEHTLDITDPIIYQNFIALKQSLKYKTDYNFIADVSSEDLEIQYVKNKQNDGTNYFDIKYTTWDGIERNLSLTKAQFVTVERNMISETKKEYDTQTKANIKDAQIPMLLKRVEDGIKVSMNFYPDLKQYLASAFLTFLYTYIDKEGFVSAYENMKHSKEDVLYTQIKNIIGDATIEDYLNSNMDSHTINYQDGMYRLINVNKNSSLQAGEINNSPVFVFECLNNTIEYNQAISLRLDALGAFLKGKPLSKEQYHIFESPLQFINEKITPTQQYIEDKPVAITMTREVGLILDLLNKVFDPKRPELWIHLMGSLGQQLGESFEDIYRVQAIYYIPTMLRVKYDAEMDTVDFLDAKTGKILDTEEIKQIAPAAITLKMMLFSDLIGTTDDNNNRKGIKTPTVQILLDDFIKTILSVDNNAPITMKTIKNFEDDLNSKSAVFNVLTAAGKNAATDLSSKIKWLESKDFFCSDEEFALKSKPTDETDAALYVIRSQINDDVIKEFKTLAVTLQEVDATVGQGEWENNKYAIWVPDTQQLSRRRGQNYEHRASRFANQTNAKAGIFKK